MKYQLEPYHRDVSDEDLIQDLKRVATELEREKVTMDEYNEHGRYHSRTLTRRFGSWFTALERAGLKQTRNLNITDEELFSNLVEVWTIYGRQPRYNDLTKDISKYCAGIYEKRFGGWRKSLQAFVKCANEGIVPTNDRSSSVSFKRKTSRNINWRLRALVLMRDAARCRLCGASPQDGVRLHVDHITPWNKCGETVLENLQILCERCNIGKSDLTIDESKKG